MSSIDFRIVSMIKKHHVLTLATCSDNEPWCASCFYAWLEDYNAFVFTSDESTKHGQQALNNKKVAANIYLETKIVGKIQGVQISGDVFQPTAELHVAAKKRYLKKFPYARLMETTIWVLMPDKLKMTDNRLGFGKKLIWEKEKI